MNRLLVSAALVIAVFLANPLLAAPLVIDFESFAEGDSITTQVPGVVITNATVLMAGSLLNEFEAPPHSGQNVAFDDGGPLSFVFATPVLSFGAFLTYFEPVTLEAFDSSDNLLGFVSSAFFSNAALSGDLGSAPNEFLQFAFPSGISSVRISGNPDGGSFVLDDATIELQAIPEPATLSLLALGGVAAYASKRQKNGSLRAHADS